MNDEKCIIQKIYDSTSGTTYRCLTHNVMWEENVFHVFPVVCPKVKKNYYDEVYKGYCEGENEM